MREIISFLLMMAFIAIAVIVIEINTSGITGNRGPGTVAGNAGGTIGVMMKDVRP